MGRTMYEKGSKGCVYIYLICIFFFWLASLACINLTFMEEMFEKFLSFPSSKVLNSHLFSTYPFSKSLKNLTSNPWVLWGEGISMFILSRTARFYTIQT